MAKNIASDERGSRTVTVTFETRADKLALDRAAEKAGVAPATFARELLIKALSVDPMMESMATLEQRIETLHRDMRKIVTAANRDVQVGTWMTLTALEKRAAGEEPERTNDWIRDKMEIIS